MSSLPKMVFGAARRDPDQLIASLTQNAVTASPSMAAARSSSTAPHDLDLGNPLTMRILGRLGRHRRFWIVAWSAAPAISPLILAFAARATADDLIGGPVSAFLAPQ